MKYLSMLIVIGSLSACLDSNWDEPDTVYCYSAPREVVGHVPEYMAEKHGYASRMLWRTTDTGQMLVVCSMGMPEYE